MTPEPSKTRSTLTDRDRVDPGTAHRARMRTNASTRPKWSQLVQYLTLRELRSRYKRTALGWGWSLLYPLFTALVLSAVFGGIFLVEAPIGDPSGLSAFTLYLLNGLLVWNAFANSTGNSMAIILNSAGLIQKVDFPRSSLVWSTCASSAVTLLIEFAVLVGLTTAFGGRGFPTTVYLLVPFVLLLLVFCAGFGMLLATFNVYFRDVAYLYSLILTAWFYLTPILYPRAIIPDDVEVLNIDVPIRAIVEANPVTDFVDASRSILYDFRPPSLDLWIGMAITATVAVISGGLVFRRFERRFAEEL